MRRFLSLRIKIIVIFCFCVIIPLLIMNLLIFNRYQQSLEKSTVNAYDMVSDQIETNLDTYLSSIKRISLYPYYNNKVQKILYDITIGGNTDVMTKENNSIMNDFLFNMLIQDKNLQSIFITDLEGKVLYNKSNGGYYRDTDYFESFIQSMDREFMVIPTHNQSYVNRARKNVFSYVRMIKEVNTNTPIGYAILEIDSNVVLTMTERISDVSDKYIAITLQDGSILNGTIPDEQMSFFERHFEKILSGNLEKRVTVDNNDYLLSVSEKSDNNLVTWIYQKEEQVMSGLNQMATLTIITIIVTSAGVLIITVLASGKLTDPLMRLRDAMIEVRKGNFKTQVKSYGGNDEVRELTDGFNDMLKYIDDLITCEYKLQIQERDANLQALQNQINPHFLYNTLESITMMAEINDDTDVAEMVTNLGEFMRYSLTTKTAMVNLREELACVENYIQIQNVRFDNHIRLKIDCPEQLRKCCIVKMSIQPVIENAILHGVKTNDSELHIDITVRMETDGLQVTIRDNGKGMDKETLLRVIRNLNQDEEIYQSKQGIGLRNVHQRMKLRYGEIYGLSFESEPDKGTTAILRLPYSMGENNAQGNGCG